MKSPIACLALLLAFVSVACQAGGGGSPAPTAVAFETLTQGSDGELDAAPQGVIRTASGFERLWSKLPQDAGSAPPIDFEREMVVYATHAGIARVVADAGFLRVELIARTGGFHLVRLARSEAPVQFQSDR